MATNPLAPNWQIPEAEYAGDVTAETAWNTLAHEPDARLVDVRTEVELNLIGKPDLSSIWQEPISIEWVTLNGLNKNFENDLVSKLIEQNIPMDAPIFFMCQSGGRSKIAARISTELGFSKSFNIAEGFEGDLDAASHRGKINGWKAAGLPWKQK